MNTKPFEMLHGPLDVYIAAVGTAIPLVNATPGGGWTKLGETQDDPSVNHKGALVYFRTNEHQMPVKAVRPEEEAIFSFTLAGLTLENYASILDRAADVTADPGPPSTKKIPLKRGYIPNEYALVVKGQALSPYGAYPGQYVITRCVVDGEYEVVFGKAKNAALKVEFHALEDPDATDADAAGYLIVQVS